MVSVGTMNNFKTSVELKISANVEALKKFCKLVPGSLLKDTDSCYGISGGKSISGPEVTEDSGCHLSLTASEKSHRDPPKCNVLKLEATREIISSSDVP